MQLVPLNMTVSERWFYFPIVGLLGLLGYIFTSFIPQTKKTVSLLSIFLIIVISILSVRTIVRNLDWKDSLTLYLHDSKIHTNWRIENDLGGLYINNKEYSKSFPHLEQSISMYPCEDNYFNLGYAHELSGNMELAKKYYSSALHAKQCLPTRNSPHLTTYFRLSRLLLLTNNPQDALKVIQEGLNNYPNKAILYALLAISHYELGNKEEALAAAQQSRALVNNKFTKYVYDQIENNQKIELQNYFQK